LPELHSLPTRRSSDLDRRYKWVMGRLSCLKGEATSFAHPTERLTPPGNLPLNRGSSMRIGCGLRVHRIDGNEYLYFWHYERENGRSRRREDYVGPARDPASRQNGGRNSSRTIVGSKPTSRRGLPVSNVPR